MTDPVQLWKAGELKTFRLMQQNPESGIQQNFDVGIRNPVD